MLRAFGRQILALMSNEKIRLTTLSAGDTGVVELLNRLARANTSRERLKITRKLRALHSRGYLTKHGEHYIASRLALQAIDEERVWSLSIPKQKRWDGKWRMVLFDIPAKKERQRRALCARLKELGLCLYQHSVWVYPYPLEKEVRAISDFYKISDCVLFATAESLNGERRLRQEFRLD